MTHLLMCPPTYFEVSYQINPWMNSHLGYKKTNLAQQQWDDLYKALSKVAEVSLIDPVEGLPDMVFTANAGLAVKNKVFLSKFTHNERKPEAEQFRQWFLHNNYYVIDQQVNCFEGEGDCLADVSDVYWMGHGFRSDDAYVNSLWRFGVNARAVELVDPRFYHIDTCFCPLPDGSLMYYPGAFSDKSRKEIEDHFRDLSRNDLIKVTEEEALTFCCNAIVIGIDIFMPVCNSVATQLTRKGYRVHEFDMSEFQKSGGACKCCVMII